jgi:hypothetical protein
MRFEPRQGGTRVAQLGHDLNPLIRPLEQGDHARAGQGLVIDDEGAQGGQSR